MKPPSFWSVPSLLLWLILLLLLPRENLLLANKTTKKTFRYRNGVNDGIGSLIGRSLLGNRKPSSSSSGNNVLEEQIVTVPDARRWCNLHENCVSFSFHSNTRFPNGLTKIYYFAYSDWHIKPKTLDSTFHIDPNWHTYINVTRELDLIVPEINMILSQFNIMNKNNDDTNADDADENDNNIVTTSISKQRRRQQQQQQQKLRGSGSSNDNDNNKNEEEDYDYDQYDISCRRILAALTRIIEPKLHRVIGTPILAPYAIKIASNTQRPDDIRIMAMKLLIFLGDSAETGKLLVQAGSYTSMKDIILQQQQRQQRKDKTKNDNSSSSNDDDDDNNNNKDEWDEISETALDVIANICFYRSANVELRQLGATEFLKDFITAPGFPGLQSAMALMHLVAEGNDGGGGHTNDAVVQKITLPESTIQELMSVLRSAIDGDMSHGIIWDLVPGPLSSIKYYLHHNNNNNPVAVQQLLDEGLFEELLRILEESENSEELFTTLEIMMSLSRSSSRAKDMILLADHTIRDMSDRLASFQKAIDLADDLSKLASRLSSSNTRNEL